MDSGSDICDVTTVVRNTYIHQQKRDNAVTLSVLILYNYLMFHNALHRLDLGIKGKKVIYLKFACFNINNFLLLSFYTKQSHLTLCSSISSYKPKDTVRDVQDVFATGQSGSHVGLLLDDAVELAKGRQSSRAHPHDQVLIDETVVLWIRIVQLVHRLPPVHRLGCT